jgi:gamma-glutamyltranspeptidase/glutathione hydrolase
LRRLRQCALLAAAAAVLSHCGGPAVPVGTVGHVTGFVGVVTADEPRAAMIGRDVLSAGGSAADAAVAMYFALSVTMPASAGLGGGGACVAHDAKGKRTEAVDFMLRPAASGFVPGAVPAAVPGNVRGMAALHARYGMLRWEQLVFPAERIARFGHPASRAFVAAVGDALPRLPADSDARALYAAPDGAPLREGSDMRQLDLAGILGQIRANGGGELYAGAVARRVSDSARASGIALAYEDLGSARPSWSAPTRAPFGSHTVDFATTAGGALGAQLWRTLGVDRRYGRGTVAERVYGLYQATLDAIGPVPPYDPGIAAFAALDAGGNATACAVTLNGPFGTGRLMRGTGIFAARPPTPDADPGLAIAPVVVSNPAVGNTYFAGAASGIAAPTALAGVLVRILGDERRPDEAMPEPRAAPAGAGAALVETGAPAEAANRIAAAGARVTAVPAIGNVGIIACPDGRRCTGHSDPRGTGFAAGGTQ